MEHTFALKLRKIFDWVSVGFTVLLGALFLINVLDVYFTGKAKGVGAIIYSREVASQRLAFILPFFIAYVVLLIVSYVLTKKTDAKKDLYVYNEPCYIFNRYKKRLPSSISVDDANYPLYLNYQKVVGQVKTYNTILTIVWGVVIAYFLTYMFLPTSFTNKDNATQEILRMVAFTFPPIFLAFATQIFLGYKIQNLCKQNMSVVRTLTKGLKPIKKTSVFDNKKLILALRVTLIAIAVVFVILGIVLKDSDGKNGVFYVLQKAINICTECIGLG